MTQDHLEVSGVFPASPEAIYDAFLDGSKHTAMTGAPATASAEVGGRFTAWDGYIEGENVHLEPPRRILQRWRAADFPDGAPASLVEIRLDAEGSGTRVLIRHAELPDGTAGRFTEGWTKFYFAPMSVYFGETPSEDDEVIEIEDDEAEVVDEDDEEAISADDATARRDTGSAPVVDMSESLREAARAEDEDDDEEHAQRADVDGAIRSLWEAAATGDVSPEESEDGAGSVRVPPSGRGTEQHETEDYDDEMRTPTMRAPAHADWAPDQEPAGIRGLASRALRGLKKLVGVDTGDDASDEEEPEKIEMDTIPLPSPSQLGRRRPPSKKPAAPKKAAAKRKAAPKKGAAKKKAAPKKGAAKKAAPKKAAAKKKGAAKKAAPKKAAAKKKGAAKKAAPKKAAAKKKGAAKKAAPKKAAAKKKGAARKAAPKKAAAKKKGAARKAAPKKKARR